METFILIHCDCLMSDATVAQVREKIAAQLQDGLGVLLIPGGFRAEVVTLPPHAELLFGSNKPT